MKILHLSSQYFPSKGGAQEVVKQLSERLAEKGHQVTVATQTHQQRKTNIINNVTIEEFDISGNAAKGYKSTEVEINRYKEFLINSDFDIVMGYAAQQWSVDILLEIIDEIKYKKVIAPCGYSSLKDARYKKYFKDLPHKLKKLDTAIYHSNTYQDIEFARTNKIRKLNVISNAADESEFMSKLNNNVKSELGIKDSNLIILSVGTHTGIKGHKETIDIFQKANLSNATLVINGYASENGCAKSCKIKSMLHKVNPGNLINNNQIILLDLDRDKLVDLYKQADIFLFTSNIECSPLVLFEACASKTPFLSTDVGNTKEIADWTKGGIIIKTKKKHNYASVDVESGIKELKRLSSDPDLRLKLANSGYKSWKQKFQWQHVADKYEKLYLELVE